MAKEKTLPEIEKLEETAEDKKEGKVELTEVVTQTTEAFKLPDGTIVNQNELLVYIANQVAAIRKVIG